MDDLGKSPYSSKPWINLLPQTVVANWEATIYDIHIVSIKVHDSWGNTPYADLKKNIYP